MTDALPDLDRLEALANAANGSGDDSYLSAWEKHHDLHSVLTPSVVLALVQEIRRLRRLLEDADEREDIAYLRGEQRALDGDFGEAP